MIKPAHIIYPSLQLIEDLVDLQLQKTDWNTHTTCDMSPVGDIPSVLVDQYKEMGWDVQRNDDDTAYTFTNPYAAIKE